ncbi:Alpha/Beta hydrolase protein [Tribonema minus]|uniref:Alpha/Beta hydrolase protein n=1 Tax=Tribonema minus TaxID=303371 RepID=A0A835YVC5_9STRA|nr:Alpha/Beta hydrolase protein [Tribonema minus]
MLWRWRKQPVVVATGAGAVAGQVEYCAASGKYVAAFRGIPYAKPPIGQLRWCPPQPADSWEGVRTCVSYGPEAPQLGADFMRFFEHIVVGHGFGKLKTLALLKGVKYVRPHIAPPQSEDCLYINVRTPVDSLWDPEAAPPRRPLPVLVYIHGGDHHDGAGGSRPYYKPHNLCTIGGVVLVTFNYRLGLFGHFTHPELNEEDAAAGGAGVSGNYSILDQVAALKWVKANIAAFGGDPECVTICGTSAGGESVTYMMVSPLARGLFHRAIAQSPGTATNSLIHLKHPFACFKPSEENGAEFAERAVGAVPGQVARMREMDVAELQQLYLADATAEPQPRQLFYPVVDGVVLPKPPIEAFWAGEQAPVPFLIGFNWDEGSLCFPVTRDRTLLRDHLYPSPVRPVGKEVYGDDAEQLMKLYDPEGGWAKSSPCGLDRHKVTSSASGGRLYLLRAGSEHANGEHHHRAHAQMGVPVYCYTFHVKPPTPGQTVGAFHGAEVPFIFGGKPWFAGGGPKDVALSAAMVDYWAAFARAGNPNLTRRRRPDWPAFDPAARRRIVLDHEIEVRGVRAHACGGGVCVRVRALHDGASVRGAARGGASARVLAAPHLSEYQGLLANARMAHPSDHHLASASASPQPPVPSAPASPLIPPPATQCLPLDRHERFAIMHKHVRAWISEAQERRSSAPPPPLQNLKRCRSLGHMVPDPPAAPPSNLLAVPVAAAAAARDGSASSGGGADALLLPLKAHRRARDHSGGDTASESNSPSPCYAASEGGGGGGGGGGGAAWGRGADDEAAAAAAATAIDPRYAKAVVEACHADAAAEPLFAGAGAWQGAHAGGSKGGGGGSGGDEEAPVELDAVVTMMAA